MGGNGRITARGGGGSWRVKKIQRGRGSGWTQNLVGHKSFKNSTTNRKGGKVKRKQKYVEGEGGGPEG